MNNNLNFKNTYNVDDIISIIRDAIDNKKPFALARYGDGEAIMLKQDLKKPLNSIVKLRFKKTMGYNITHNEFKTYINEWIECLKYIDINSFQTKNWFNNIQLWFYNTLISKNYISDQSINIPITLIKKLICKNLDKIIKSHDDLILITSRPNAKKQIELETKAKVRHIITIPSEYNFRDKFKEKTNASQFPHIMKKIINIDIPKFVNKGTVVLLGVGPPKVLYCKAIKQAGGIAIDIGSVLDLKAGLLTRGKNKGTFIK